MSSWPSQERTLLKLGVPLTILAIALVWWLGAETRQIWTTGYVGLTIMCSLLAYARHRRNRLLEDSLNAIPSLVRVVPRARPKAPLISFRGSPVQVRASLVGLVLAVLAMVAALLPQARGVSGGLVVGAMALGSAAAWRRLGEGAERRVEPSQRCPFCRSGFCGEEQAVTCGECETIYHSECREEWPTCAVLGCGGDLRRAGTFRVQGRRVQV